MKLTLATPTDRFRATLNSGAETSTPRTFPDLPAYSSESEHLFRSFRTPTLMVGDREAIDVAVSGVL
jgi:hypothetical protein